MTHWDYDQVMYQLKPSTELASLQQTKTLVIECDLMDLAGSNQSYSKAYLLKVLIVLGRTFQAFLSHSLSTTYTPQSNDNKDHFSAPVQAS